MAKRPRVHARKRFKSIKLTIRELPFDSGAEHGVIGAHGTNLAQFLVALFDANERLPPEMKLDDAHLRECILSEFNAPGQSRTIDGLRERRITVAQLRARYNHGDYTRQKGKGVRPEELGLMRATRRGST